jgi:CRP-like cAMP-binding protein
MNPLDLHNHQVMEYLEQALALSPPAFKNFPSDDLNDFLRVGEVEFHDQGECIADEIEPTCETAFFVLDGRISLHRDGISLSSHGPGCFLEETFLFAKGPRLASIIASEPSTVIKFRRSVVMHYFRSKQERLFTIFILNILDLQQRRVHHLTTAYVKAQKAVLDHLSGELK